MTNSWTSGATPILSRVDVGIGVINGKMYVVGGCLFSDCRIGTTNQLEIYDPVANSWSLGASMVTARYGATIGVIAGKLYVTGGTQACPPCTTTSTTEIYDPVANNWTSGASIPTSTESPAGAVVNGLLYSSGGYEQDSVNNPVGIVQIYDPVADSWSTGSPMPTARAQAAAGVINGDIYVAGGNPSAGPPLATNESYDPPTDSWTEQPSMPTARHYAAGSVVNSNLYVIGGNTSNNVPVAANEEFSLPSTWVQLSPTGGPPSPRFQLAGGHDEATNRMIIFGGAGGNISYVPTMLNDTWVLSDADGIGAPAWTQLAPTGGPPAGREGHSAVYDPVSNSLIIFGGDLAEGSCFEDANDVWVLQCQRARRHPCMDPAQPNRRPAERERFAYRRVRPD